MENNKIPNNKEITYFAKTNFRNAEKLFGIKNKDRRQHMYIVGKSGSGKSVMMENMISQDIKRGEGLCVIDPHGELIESVLNSIPEERQKDVIYLNPADTEYDIGLNILEVDNPEDKHVILSGVMDIFSRIWEDSWNSEMQFILNNTILALLDTKGTTVLSIQRMLLDKNYREMIIENLEDKVLSNFWKNEYEEWKSKYQDEAIAPIQNKIGQFISTPMIRNMVGQAESTINISDVMNNGKILLVNISKGRLGEENSTILGNIIVTKIRLEALERVKLPESKRRDFYLYIDEFQNFVTESFTKFISDARKYHLNLILAHQYIAQLESQDKNSMHSAIFGNVGTTVVFRVGSDDAEFLEKEFSPEFDAEDLVHLPNYHIYLRLMIDGEVSRPFSAVTVPPPKVEAEASVKEKVIKLSNSLYAKNRKEVEDEITRWSSSPQNFQIKNK